MKINKTFNFKHAKNHGDYYLTEEGTLILNCPFCGNKMLFQSKYILKQDSKISIIGSDWIKCCKYFLIENNEVIEMK